MLAIIEIVITSQFLNITMNLIKVKINKNSKIPINMALEILYFFVFTEIS